VGPICLFLEVPNVINLLPSAMTSGEMHVDRSLFAESFGIEVYLACCLHVDVDYVISIEREIDDAEECTRRFILGI